MMATFLLEYESHLPQNETPALTQFENFQKMEFKVWKRKRGRFHTKIVWEKWRWHLFISTSHTCPQNEVSALPQFENIQKIKFNVW